MATQKFLDQNGLSTLWTKIKGLTAPYALTAARATYAASAGYAQSALTASRATTAGFSTTASNATYAASAGSATTASRATYAASAGYVAKAADSDKLDGLDSTAFATAGHTHSLPQESIYWSSGSTNSDVTPIEMAMSSIHSANRLMFANPAGIKAEYSTDGGSTWKDYGLSNEQKISLVSGLGTSISIGKKSSGITVNDKFRITINATNCGMYTACKRILLNVTTNGAGGSNVKLEYSNKGSETTFKHYGTYNIGGWSSWNAIPFISAFGGSSDQTYNAAVIRLTFGITSVSTSYPSNLSLLDLQLHGATYWDYPSGMAKTNHLYSWDTAQNATFPADVYATNFRGTLIGSASQATTAGYAITAARATYAASAGSAGSSTTASNATYAASAGYAQSALTASRASTAGYSTTASNATYAASAGSSTTASNATYAASAGSAGSSTTASYAVNADKLDGLQATAFATAGHTHAYATQSDINTAISNLINGATSTLDTLNELATALGNDPNYATTISTALANKANKNGDNVTADSSWPIKVRYASTASTAGYSTTAAFAVTAAAHTHSYLSLSGGELSNSDWNGQLQLHRGNNGTNWGPAISFYSTKDSSSSKETRGFIVMEAASNNLSNMSIVAPDAATKYKVWHEGNDGSTSGLDADLLDGNHATAFATAGHTHNGLTDKNVQNNTTTLTYYLCGSTSSSNVTGTLVKRTDVYVNGSGALYAVKFHESSDETLKNFKEDINVNLDELSKLPKKYFTWKKDENGELCIGTSAQELQKLYPELVDTNVDGTLTVDYNKLSIIALAAIDKLNDKNKELEERLEKVEKILSKLNIE